MAASPSALDPWRLRSAARRLQSSTTRSAESRPDEPPSTRTPLSDSTVSGAPRAATAASRRASPSQCVAKTSPRPSASTRNRTAKPVGHVQSRCGDHRSTRARSCVTSDHRSTRARSIGRSRAAYIFKSKRPRIAAPGGAELEDAREQGRVEGVAQHEERLAAEARHRVRPGVAEVRRRRRRPGLAAWAGRAVAARREPRDRDVEQPRGLREQARVRGLGVARRDDFPDALVAQHAGLVRGDVCERAHGQLAEPRRRPRARQQLHESTQVASKKGAVLRLGAQVPDERAGPLAQLQITAVAARGQELQEQAQHGHGLEQRPGLVVLVLVGVVVAVVRVGSHRSRACVASGGAHPVTAVAEDSSG